MHFSNEKNVCEKNFLASLICDLWEKDRERNVKILQIAIHSEKLLFFISVYIKQKEHN